MMAQLAFNAAQTWLRAFVEEPCEEIEFSIEAQETMRKTGTGLAEVMHVLRTGVVISAVKLREGADLFVTGRNCDGENLEVVCWIEVNLIQVRVVRIWHGG
jgi:hypothetical protein